MPISLTLPRRPSIRLVAAIALALSAALAMPAAEAGASGGDGYAGVSGDAGLTPGSGVAGRIAATGIRGVDVSHWQGTIDWAKVATSGIRFAYLKASEGTTYVDPTFAVNRAGARANGVRVGAYHFARPDDAPGDARREARFFVQTAEPKPGNLLPVLDIERTGGLDQAGVTRWARRWVAEVRELTGVTPMVYTSPYGWLERTGDTRRLARDGAPLWVAHWGVSSPTLPANGWAGNGWVVWQWSSTGSVPGIAGDVDLDRLSGATLGRITIRRLSIEVTGGVGKVTSQPAGLGCRATCVHNLDPQTSVTLSAVPDEGSWFTGWTGACRGTDPTCTIRMGGNRSVGARFVSDVKAPSASFIRPVGFTDPVEIAFDEPVMGVTPWNVVLRLESGDRVAVRRACRAGAGAVVPCDAASVRRVRLTARAPLVPGADYETVVNPVGATSVTDLAGNPALTAKDRFVAPASVEQTQAPLALRPARAWTRVGARAASGDSFIVSGRAGAVARLTFDGVGVRWIAVTGPNRGRAHVFVDGALVRTVDLYAPARTYGVVRRFTGLADRRHTIRIVVLGRARRAATDDLVAIDRLDVVTS
jgi:GH25 family lysozyme M1 (1,4-beta-N-acetylmuramidase)